MGLKSLTIVPMGSPAKAEEAKEEPKEDDGDGLRESYDEFVEAFNEGDHDMAYAALKDFVDMCAMKSTGGEY